MQLFSFGEPEDPSREFSGNRGLFPGGEKNGTGVSGGTSNGQKTKTKEKKIQKINTIYRTVTQETQ